MRNCADTLLIISIRIKIHFNIAVGGFCPLFSFLKHRNICLGSDESIVELISANRVPHRAHNIIFSVYMKNI